MLFYPKTIMMHSNLDSIINVANEIGERYGVVFNKECYNGNNRKEVRVLFRRKFDSSYNIIIRLDMMFEPDSDESKSEMLENEVAKQLLNYLMFAKDYSGVGNNNVPVNSFSANSIFKLTAE